MKPLKEPQKVNYRFTELTPGEMAEREQEYAHFRLAHFDEDYEGDNLFDYRGYD